MQIRAEEQDDHDKVNIALMGHKEARQEDQHMDKLSAND